MLVVDAGCLFEVVAATSTAEVIRQRLLDDPEQFTPHLVDVEVFSVIRRRASTAASRSSDRSRSRFEPRTDSVSAYSAPSRPSPL